MGLYTVGLIHRYPVLSPKWWAYTRWGLYTGELIFRTLRYITFNTNLSICSIKKYIFILPQCTWMCLSLMLVLLLNGCEEYQILIFIFSHSPYVRSLVEIVLNSSKLLSLTISGTLSIYIFSLAITPVAHILCLMIFQTWCCLCTKNVPHWLLVILLILSNDIHLNPGPHLQNNVFNFMS